MNLKRTKRTIAKQSRCGEVIHEGDAYRISERAKGQSSGGVSRVHLSMQGIRVRDEMVRKEAARGSP